MADVKKFVLMDIIEQEYTDDLGVKKPYFDIYIKVAHQNKETMKRYRALRNETFAFRLPDYMALVGKEITPVFDSKTNKAGTEVAVVADILIK
jgi:hypothetical protein